MIDVKKKVIHEEEILISFGDSQRPETYRFTVAEAKLLHKKLRDVLYGPVNMP